jgi:hypothetical protein
MKGVFVTALFLVFASIAFADCDLFKEEVKIIESKVNGMYKKLYETDEFSSKAEANKTESDNEKLGRYLKNVKKEIDLIEHGMSQLKLHQECACPNFNFGYVDKLLIEMKFFLKKAQSYPIDKPKKTDYASIKMQLEKTMARATDLQVYFTNPCKNASPVLATNETAIDSVVPLEKQQEDAITSISDSTESALENTETSIEQTQEEVAALATGTVNTDSSETGDNTAPKAQVAVAMDTVKHTDVSVNEALASNESTSENPKNAGSNNTSASPANSSGSNVAKTAAVAAAATGATVVAVATSNQSKTDSTQTQEPNETETTTQDEVQEPTATEAAIAAVAVPMDTIKHTDSSVVESNQEVAMDTVRHLDHSAEQAVATSAAAVAASTIVDSTEAEKEEIPEEEPAVVMDTVRHKDVVKAPESTVAAVAIPDKPVEPMPEPKPESTPLTENNAVKSEPNNTKPDTDFYYAVQIATGNANTQEGKYAQLNETVYSMQEGGMTKYRVGKYKDLNSAVNTKRKAFNTGFLDAFVVAYNNGQRISIGEAKAIESGQSVSSTNAPKTTSTASNIKTEPAKTKKAEKIKKNATVFLAIQVGASITTSDPIYEMVKYERMIGEEVKVLHGDPNRFYSGEFTTRDQAEQLLSKIKAAGILDAFLIGVADGKRIDYNQAIEFLAQ